MALTAVMLVVGVWALKTVNFTVGGNLSYIAPGIEATISKGTMSNGVWVNASDASTKMPLTQITTTDTEESLEEKFSYWQDLNLNFNEAGDDVTITFSITNDMEDKYLSISVTTSYASADNATISINTSSVSLVPNASQEFIITLAVADKTANATLSDFAVIFHMEMGATITKAEDVSYLTFTYDDTTMEAQLKRCDTSVTSVKIPARILYNEKEYTVTSMYSHAVFPTNGVFYNCTSLTSVIIPDTMTNIGLGAFYNCTSLTKVVIGEGVTSIGWHAFAYCSSLTSITIPDEITSIGACLFLNSGITSITIPDKVTSIGDSAFSNCKGLTTITIPASVTSIGQNPFSGCSGLETIIVESGNTAYNSNNNCNAIIETSTNTLITGCKNAIIPSTVTSIGSYAFSDCTGLTSITIPDSVTSIGTYAFRNCTGLTSVTIGSGVTSIGNYAFNSCTGLTSITIPEKVTSIGQYAFSGCSGLESIIVESGNTAYNSNNNCNAIIETSTNTLISGCKNTVIPSTVTSIKYSAFNSCTGLTSITIPDSVTSIGNNAFNGCTGLTSVTIGSGVTSIGQYAFSDCTGLNQMTCNATTPPTLGAHVFSGCSFTLTIPSESVDAYKASDWGDYIT